MCVSFELYDTVFVLRLTSIWFVAYGFIKKLIHKTTHYSLGRTP